MGSCFSLIVCDGRAEIRGLVEVLRVGIYLGVSRDQVRDFLANRISTAGLRDENMKSLISGLSDAMDFPIEQPNDESDA